MQMKGSRSSGVERSVASSVAVAVATAVTWLIAKLHGLLWQGIEDELARGK